MIVGYARTSTVDQVAGFEAQVKELAAAGCEKVFHEQVSSVTVRLQLQSALEFIREGDVFVVTKLDRLARSITDGHPSGVRAQGGRRTDSQPGHGHPNAHRQADADGVGRGRSI